MRHRFLSHPRFQTFFTLSFAAGAALIVSVFGFSSWTTLTYLSETLPLAENQRIILQSGAHQLVLALTGVGVLLMIVFAAIGFYLSYKFVGPLSRLENWLENHLAGERQPPFKARKGDELNHAVKLLFQILEKRRLI